MSKAVADLIKALPESSFDNTGGGCMVVAMPAPSAERPDGAIVITGVYGASGCDNFSWGEDSRNGDTDMGLTGFFAMYHAEWYGEDPQDVDPVLVYESAYTSPFDGLDPADYPEDEDAFVVEMERRQAQLEVDKTVAAIREFIRTLG